jgi:hypothetical protein
MDGIVSIWVIVIIYHTQKLFILRLYLLLFIFIIIIVYPQCFLQII